MFRTTHFLMSIVFQYDPQFGDAFWNSSKYGMVTYLLRMMTSWAIVCSVWYLPPMTREVGASSYQRFSFSYMWPWAMTEWPLFISYYRKMKMPSSLPIGWNLPLPGREDWWTCCGKCRVMLWSLGELVFLKQMPSHQLPLQSLLPFLL